MSEEPRTVVELIESATIEELRVYAGALWHERNGWRHRAFEAERKLEGRTGGTPSPSMREQESAR